MEAEASDVHLHAQCPPWMQVGGLVEALPDLGVLSVEEVAAAAEGWIGGWGVSSSVTWPRGQMWRSQSLLSVSGPVVTLRRLPSRPPDMAFLGSNLAEVAAVVNMGAGLVVVAGATGAGKSTTCAALLSLMNRTRACHVFSIEAPIEVVFRPDRALFTQVEVGTHVGTAREALVASLRSAPDVIFLSEVRHPEEMRLCLEAAITGHLVITTMHASDVGTVCERLIGDDGMQAQSKLAQSFQMSVSQRLLPDRDNPRVRHAFAEIVPRDSALTQYIRSGQTSKINAHVSNALGGGLDAQLAAGVSDGLISQGTAAEACIDRDEMFRRLDAMTASAGRR